MATRTFTGFSQPVAKQVTITLGGTPSAADTVQVAMNNKEIVYTVVGTMTAIEVAIAVAALLGATQLAEFQEVTWYNDGLTAVITAYASNPGVPFTFTATKTGSITLAQSTTVTGKGPASLLDPDNWDTFPIAADSVIFPATTQQILYDLDALAGLALANVYFLGGTIGLPVMNVLGYVEYRGQEIQLDADNIYIGDGSTGVDYLRMAIVAGTTAAVVVRNGQEVAADVDNLNVIVRTTSGSITAMNVETGGVGLGTLGSGAGATIGTLTVGTDGPDGSIGASDEAAAVVWSTASAITTGVLLSGVVVAKSSCACTIRAGTWYQAEGNIGAVTNTGGTLAMNSAGTMGAVSLNGDNALLDMSGDTRPVSSITSLSALNGGYFFDLDKRLGNLAFVLDDKSARKCVFGRNFTLTRS